jgi:hypothetical protein
MTPAGWCIMLLSVGGVTLLFLWCLWRVLLGPKAPSSDQLHSALDIDTQDTDTADPSEPR